MRSYATLVLASAAALTAATGLAAKKPLVVSTADDVPSWSGEIAAIVHRSCVSCHRPGEIAPMSLLSYSDARPWAKSIRRVVADRTMPPWHADSTKVEYSNDRSLSDAEVDLIVRWATAGAPLGDGPSPPPPQFRAGWRLGEPDLVFRPKAKFRVPITDAEIPYQSVVYAVDVPEDLYIAAWELRPSHLAVVHHANLVRSPTSLDGQSVGIASAVMAGGDYIGSYLPGHSTVTYPNGIAYKLPKGSHLGIQVHYVSVGEEVEDETLFGVHLADGRIDKIVRVVGTDYRAIAIPPGEAHYEIVDEIDLLLDMYALSSGVHMHLRGAAFRMEAILPGGANKLITDVPRYDFNWQSNYMLAQPVFLPQGSKLRVTSVWDNSPNNPHNPAPDQWVRYGPWTNDEMVNSWAHVVLADEKLGLQVEAGRVVGRFPDGSDFQAPFLIQSLPQAPAFRRNAEEPQKQGGHDGR